jgi:hypothetical protein
VPKQGPPELVDFRTDDRATVLARMEDLARVGRGWVNLSPALDEDEELPRRSSTFGLFSGRGPDVPLCTWVPGTPTEIGIQHGAGPKVSRILRELGEAVPEGWRITQDHSRRGLVAAPPEGTSNEEMLDWMLRAGTALAAHLRLAGWWRAAVYRPGPAAQRR